MSSIVPRSKRTKRKPRQSISDFSAAEQKAIEAARHNFGSPVVVFGSRAKGNFADDSDIDIGVKGYLQRQHKALADHMTKYSGIKVDLFKFDDALTHSGAVTL